MIDNKYIVKSYDIYKEVTSLSTKYFITFEFIKGTTLWDLCVKREKESKRFSLDFLITIF